MQPREKTVVEKALDTFRKRTRIGADFLYEKTGTDLQGYFGIVGEWSE